MLFILRNARINVETIRSDNLNRNNYTLMASQGISLQAFTLDFECECKYQVQRTFLSCPTA
jgi:hypothetical protein